jgi:hypothetical protein
MPAKKKRPLRKSYAGVAPSVSQRTTKQTTEAAPHIDEWHRWQAKLHAAQEALAAAENPNTFHEWLSPQQKYTVLDHIDEVLEELVYDLRYAPGLHILPPLPNLTPALNILLAQLRGRIMRRLNLEGADKHLRQALGPDRS